LDLGLINMYRTSSTYLTIYSNVDWVDYPNTRNSISSDIVFLGDILISSCFKHKLALSQSSAVVEYRVVVNCITEAKLCYHLLELHYPTQCLHMYWISPTDLTIYSNVDWVSYPNTQNSISCYIVFVGDNLSWFKHKPMLSRSNVEVKYLRHEQWCVAEARLCYLLGELHYDPILHVTLVYCDNINVIYLLTNLIQHQQSKHVEIDLHLVCECVTLEACGV
jgi:hypothetical protein